MIDISFFNILGVAVGSIFITSFYQPIQDFKNRLLDKLPDNYLGRSIITIFTCPKCLAFTLSLVVFVDVLAAVLTSIIAYFLNHLIDRVEEWYQ